MTTPASAPRVSLTGRRLIVAASWGLLALIVLGSLVAAYTVSTTDSGDATREVLFNVGHVLRWLLYLATMVAFVLLGQTPVGKSV